MTAHELRQTETCGFGGQWGGGPTLHARSKCSLLSKWPFYFKLLYIAIIQTKREFKTHANLMNVYEIHKNYFFLALQDRPMPRSVEMEATKP